MLVRKENRQTAKPAKKDVGRTRNPFGALGGLAVNPL
jgi:hypothetical protein